MRKLGLLILTPLLLAGCLGGKKAPDATLVADAPSLVIPPSFDLRPPRTDENGKVIERTTADVAAELKQEAQNILVGETVEPAKNAPAQADSWLVKKAGGDSRNASIRELMARETKARQEKEAVESKKGWFSRNFGKKGDLEPVDTVDVEESSVEY